jgi:probable rRNA maturation factor
MRLTMGANPAFPEVAKRSAPWLRHLVRLAARLGASEACVEVSWVDDQAICELNRQWREIDAPTDVLSFHYGQEAAGLADPADDPLGEIVVSVETARRQAAAEGHSTEEELSLLVIHGVHHILGFDHEDAAEAAAMAEAEMPARLALARYFRSRGERS